VKLEEGIFKLIRALRIKSDTRDIFGILLHGTVVQIPSREASTALCVCVCVCVRVCVCVCNTSGSDSI
jgi:hypothetical protein